MITREQDASSHRGHYSYRSEERSDRTGGHLWTERNAETNWGTVKYLVSEDGKPLTSERIASERGKLAEEAVQPEAFQRQEAKENDDVHSQQLLTLLTKAFLFDPPRMEGQEIWISYRPDPSYTPQSLEERALHSMSGVVKIDGSTMRLREIDGSVPQDVSLGFGPFATLHAGSAFSTSREQVEGSDWKTDRVHTAIKGRAMFVKTIARQQDSEHDEFKKIASGMTVGEAVAIVEQ